ncbi:MAG: SusD/RagB family nutrient-binding outer membrane lipoprotein [Alistipes sp.]
MKINKILRASLYALCVCAVAACTANYEDINQDPYGVGPDDMEGDGYNISSALVGMQGWVIPTTALTYQFTDCLLGGSWGGYLADSNQSFNSGKFSTYNPSDGWMLVMFKDIIPKIYSSHKMLKAVTTDAVPLAIADIINVAALHRITDCYGPIPYSQIGAGGQLKAPYDSQEAVYKRMFEELTAAAATLEAHQTETISANADKVYAGDVLKWIKYANSLKLRLAVRLSYADAATAQKMAEEAVNNKIGVMTTNADNAALSSFGKDGNPAYVVMWNWNGGDSRIGADIASYMNGYADPRRAAYFTKSTFTAADNIPNDYYGLRSGIDIDTKEAAQKYSNAAITPNTPLMWMNASEVAFLRAEGALRGWSMGGSAESFYNDGIRLSFAQWGVAGAETYLGNSTARPQVYRDPRGLNNYAGEVSSIRIKWNNGDGTEKNLERIITQKWIANFLMGQEAWADYRRTGYPHLMPVVSNRSEGGVVNAEEGARRLKYPLDEYTTNAENVTAAVASYLDGADNLATHVWWDCKNK